MHRRIQICSIFIIAPLTLIHPTAIGEIQKTENNASLSLIQPVWNVKTKHFQMKPLYTSGRHYLCHHFSVLFHHYSLLLSRFFLSDSPLLPSIPFHLISHFALAIYSVLIIYSFCLKFPSSPTPFLAHPITSSSSPLHPVSPSFTCPPSSSLFLLGQQFSWCLTKHGICIGKVPQNMACCQRRRWKWSGISYQMSPWPHQPSLLSRENRSPLWLPMTHTYTQTHVCAGIATYDFVH